jgi:hypothetical protein
MTNRTSELFDSRGRPAANLIRPIEAALFLGRSVKSLSLDRQKGRGCRYYKIGGLVFYDAQDLAEFRASCLRQSTRDPQRPAQLADAAACEGDDYDVFFADEPRALEDELDEDIAP